MGPNNGFEQIGPNSQVQLNGSTYAIQIDGSKETGQNKRVKMDGSNRQVKIDRSKQTCQKILVKKDWSNQTSPNRRSSQSGPSKGLKQTGPNRWVQIAGTKQTTTDSGPHTCWWRVHYQRGLCRLVFTFWQSWGYHYIFFQHTCAENWTSSL